ncbi:response regulator [Bacteriovorax sp. DB6_IX]|uniref:response regulator n=1 Tax=Bacteriovorax sp. DB6_IX TaxID=1353530 RepID=UPI000389F7D5|nr:response regulator [Bacteriovorax sp. DB6_IX]EQC49754.1 response regulator receiver domain protein [Bacteriovorax sp. DB6_IX]
MTLNLPKVDEGNKPSVLIVDDEEKICLLIKTFLTQTRKFKNIVIAESVSVALLKLRNEKFDLVIIDYKLPDKDGTSLVDLTSKSLQFRNLKYLMISGYLDGKSMMKVIDAGVKEVLVKPFTRDALIKKVSKVLKK